MIAFVMLAIQYLLFVVLHSTNTTDSFGYIDLVFLLLFIVQTLFVFFRLFYFVLNNQEDLVAMKNYKLVRIVENIIIITSVIIISGNLFLTFFWAQ